MRVRAVIEVRQHHARECRRDPLLDGAESLLLRRRHERDDLARRAGASRAAATVDVVVGRERHVEVDDVRDALHVDAARRHVGGHQHRVLSATERLERGDAVFLPAIGMDAGRPHAAAGDRACELVGIAFPLHEDQHGGHCFPPQQGGEELGLPRLRHRVDALHDAAGRLLRAHHHDDGIAQDVVRERADIGGHRRREHERLSFDRERPEDPADVGKKAHVEHPVRLVEHDDLERGIVDVAEPHVVQEPARRRDDDLGAGAKRPLLRAHVYAAHYGDRREPDVVPERQRLLVDLHGQLARRRKNEGAQLAAHGPGVQPLQDREEECGRLARPGRGTADQVAAGQDHRNGFGLDRRRARVPHVPHRLGQRGDQLKLLQRGGHAGCPSR